MNGKGRPLTSHDVVVNLIASTKTKTGLKVKAKLDKGIYPKGIKISDKVMSEIDIKEHKFHGDWNYTISPRI